jgi:hypothetical protein
MARTVTEEEFTRIQREVQAKLDAMPGLSEQSYHAIGESLFQGALAEAEHSPKPVEGSALARFVSNAGGYLNPVTMVKGLYESIKSPEAVEGTLRNIYNASAAQAGKAAEAFRQGRYVEAAGHGAATVPVLGPAAAAAGEQIAEGDVAGGLGSGVGLVGSILAPGAVKAGAATAPAVAARAKVAGALEGSAVRLARAGVKAPLTLLKQQAGASTTGVNFQATKLAKYLIDNRLTSPGQATRIIKNTEAELQRILAAKGATPTDAPARAQLYLDILERQAAKAVNPEHAATVRAVAADMIDQSVLGETVTTTVMRPSPTGLVNASGQPVLVPTTQTSRALRASVPADEALDIARKSSQFETRRSWGEQKGTAKEAAKAQERAVRDAVKQALPETRTPLEQQGQAILAEKVLDRQVWRELNRDVVSLPGLVGLSANAVVGFAAHWLRNNQLRAGIWANDLAKAIAAKNAPATAGILSRLGVRRPALGPLLAEFGAPGALASPAATAAQGAPPGE